MTDIFSYGIEIDTAVEKGRDKSFAGFMCASFGYFKIRTISVESFLDSCVGQNRSFNIFLKKVDEIERRRS